MTNNEPDYDNLFFEEKKMQKTPEVGDVWEDDSGYKVLILKTFISYSEAISENFFYRIIYNRGCAKKDYKDISSYVYIGKSKANINDLFEVQDE